MSVPRPVTALRAVKVRPDRHVELPEHVVTEEPMQILVAGPGQEPAPLAVTMRTPGHDFELAAGFVVTEGVAAGGEIQSVDYCQAFERTDPAARWNHVTVRLARIWEPPADSRYFTASSSCGACGKATIDQVETRCRVVVPGAAVPASLIADLPNRLRRAQTTFDRTGGLHAAGLFERDGSLCCAREDVGRHNAVDKVVGWSLLSRPGGPASPRPRPESGGSLPTGAGSPLAGTVLALSGRVSFEIVQKAAMAGIGLLAAVSAPSSLAVAAGERLGVTVAAFVRGGTFNVYSHPERVAFDC